MTHDDFRSVVIDFLQKTKKAENIAVCYFYCHYKEQDQQTAVNLLGSLLRQLATNHQHIIPAVMKLHEKFQKEDRNCRPSLLDYTQILSEVLLTFDNVYVVLDALDECSMDERDKFILGMKQLPLQLLVTSRHIPDILELFQGVDSLEIRANANDIRSFLQSQMVAKSGLARLVKNDKTLSEDIVQHITTRADGMCVYPLTMMP